MYTLNLFIENYTNGYKQEFLDIFFLSSVLSSIFVIISKNPIISVLFLIGLFLSVSGYLFMLGINFIGLSYLLVYIGAVSILFLFILMLINIRISELLTYTGNSVPLGIIFSLFLYSILTMSSFFNNNVKLDNTYKIEEKNNIFSMMSKYWDNNIIENSHITSIGNILYTSHFIWLIITSIILLLAMVGAIIITIKQKSLPKV